MTGTVQPGHHRATTVPPPPSAPNTQPGLSGLNGRQGRCSGHMAGILQRGGPRLARQTLDTALGVPSTVRGELPPTAAEGDVPPQSTPSAFLDGTGPCALPGWPSTVSPKPRCHPTSKPSTPSRVPAAPRPAQTHEGATGDGLAGADRGQQAASGGPGPTDGQGGNCDGDPRVGARGQLLSWCPLPREGQKAAVHQGPVSTATPATWAVTT